MSFSVRVRVARWEALRWAEPRRVARAGNSRIAQISSKMHEARRARCCYVKLHRRETQTSAVTCLWESKRIKHSQTSRFIRSFLYLYLAGFLLLFRAFNCMRARIVIRYGLEIYSQWSSCKDKFICSIFMNKEEINEFFSWRMDIQSVKKEWCFLESFCPNVLQMRKNTLRSKDSKTTVLWRYIQLQFFVTIWRSSRGEGGIEMSTPKKKLIFYVFQGILTKFRSCSLLLIDWFHTRDFPPRKILATPLIFSLQLIFKTDVYNPKKN